MLVYIVISEHSHWSHLAMCTGLFVLPLLGFREVDIKKTLIPTLTRIWRPDLIAWHPTCGTWILDAQVVGDATIVDLGEAHAQKVAYYNTETITTHVRELLGFQLIIFTVTLNWRWALAPASVNSWLQLRLLKADLTILSIIVLKGSAAIWKEFMWKSGGVWTLPH